MLTNHSCYLPMAYVFPCNDTIYYIDKLALESDGFIHYERRTLPIPVWSTVVLVCILHNN